ncbi:hypothetical protein BaRGS_00003100 [Batillaria attramentaria]|uniref:Uncharacterized protein n=1 Tax=Batillaria attramentaria TaxID=370345 RepID=A0ABD0M1Z8_9CAEN
MYLNNQINVAPLAFSRRSDAAMALVKQREHSVPRLTSLSPSAALRMPWQQPRSESGAGAVDSLRHYHQATRLYLQTDDILTR